ncbi:MAG: aminotransferase class IV [Verrucomicrobia bacterium]|nr:aminotransferase class IV [Verrucomicrobiota bacterium]
MSSFIWLNGTICRLAEARISPLDHGLLVGDGVFETLVARQGRPFAVREHWQRLVNSCEIMGLTPLPLEDYLAAIEAVLKANQLSDARLRVTLTSGDGPLGSDRGNGPKTVFVTAVPLKPWPPTEKVCLVPWTLNENGPLAGAKSVSYGGNVRALALAKSKDCGEALMANTRGEVCEGTGSNVFLVLQGRLVTPPLSSGCLPGITRDFVIRACLASGISCDEEALPVSALAQCEEAFLTSSTRDVHPISELDGRSLITPGPITQKVAAAFHQFVAEQAV